MKILDIPKWKYFHIFMYLIVHKKFHVINLKFGLKILWFYPNKRKRNNYKTYIVFLPLFAFLIAPNCWNCSQQLVKN